MGSYFVRNPTADMSVRGKYNEASEASAEREVDGHTVHRYLNPWQIAIDRPCSACGKETVDETLKGEYVCLTCDHIHNFTF